MRTLLTQFSNQINMTQCEIWITRKIQTGRGGERERVRWREGKECEKQRGRKGVRRERRESGGEKK